MKEFLIEPVNFLQGYLAIGQIGGNSAVHWSKE